ncbi:hypothetical protein EI94DRAFT_1805650 [Lactarius quietus]|nr:hypothetical protein EI94DRAFT_1805650 [Lactarius quietus]
MLVASNAQERGHSITSQVEACAEQWSARQLVLNHIDTRAQSLRVAEIEGSYG